MSIIPIAGNIVLGSRELFIPEFKYTIMVYTIPICYNLCYDYTFSSHKKCTL